MLASLTLDDRDFDRVARLAHERFGLALPSGKRDMVQNRLSKLARRKGAATLRDLLDLIERSDSPLELLGLFDVLSTNLTSFFRESVHLELLRDLVLRPAAAGAARGAPRRLRLWSAGCSNGCEPFSIGIVLAEELVDLARWDVRILATDLAETELATARRGEYAQRFVQGVPHEILEKYFSRVRRGSETLFKVDAGVRRLVTLGLLNLMERWPMRGPFDAIFCRNVMIYFDTATRAELIARYTDLLRPGGLLAIGCSENLAGEHPRLRRVGPSAYTRIR